MKTQEKILLRNFSDWKTKYIEEVGDKPDDWMCFEAGANFRDKFNNLFRDFLRTNHLTSNWQDFLTENNL